MLRLPVQKSYGELQTSRKGNPQKIRDVCVHDPAEFGYGVPDCVECPGKRAEYEQNIERCEEIIF